MDRVIREFSATVAEKKVHNKQHAIHLDSWALKDKMTRMNLYQWTSAADCKKPSRYLQRHPGTKDVTAEWDTYQARFFLVSGGSKVCPLGVHILDKSPFQVPTISSSKVPKRSH